MCGRRRWRLLREFISLNISSLFAVVRGICVLGESWDGVSGRMMALGYWALRGCGSGWSDVGGRFVLVGLLLVGCLNKGLATKDGILMLDVCNTGLGSCCGLGIGCCRLDGLFHVMSAEVTSPLGLGMSV